MRDISQRIMHSPDSDVISRFKGEKTKQQVRFDQYVIINFVLICRSFNQFYGAKFDE